MNAERDSTREDLELAKIRKETQKMSVDMEREYKTLRANIEHDLEQRHHWKMQRWYWIGAGIIAIVAVVTTPLIKHYFPPTSAQTTTTAPPPPANKS